MFLSIAISVHSIASADDKVDATKRELAVTGEGIEGGIAGGALAGLAWISFGSRGIATKMNMRLVDELTLKSVEGLPEDAVPISEIFVNGVPTGKRISGAILEAAARWQDKYLLFTTDNRPFEEFLGIRLLDSQFNLLDSVEIGAPYSTGSFSSLELHEPNAVSFLFIGETTWRVELLPTSGFRLPFVSEPAGVWRAFGFRRHFAVHGNPRRQLKAR